MIGKKIREIRTKQGMTQKQLGERAGIAEPTIRKYELGKLNPKLETIRKITDALGVPIDTLLDIKPLKTQYVAVREGDETKVPLNNNLLEYEAFDEYLKQIGYKTFMDLARFKNPKGKHGDVWIIYDKREDKCYSATTEDLDQLMDNIVSYTKFQIHELLSRLNPVDQEEAKEKYKSFMR